MRRTPALIAIAVALSLGGCGLFGGDDAEEAAAAEQAAVEASYEPVVEVRDIEIGRIRNGLVITAVGTAPGVGYSRPELRPRREGQAGPDGYLDFDFVARAPRQPPATSDAPARARSVRADRLIEINDLRGVRGIRIHAAEGGMLMNF